MIAVPSLRAQSDTDFYEQSSYNRLLVLLESGGTIENATTGDVISLHKEIGFNSYSTFSGELDWKFTRKNHIYLAKGPD